jgi:hypothetical protein
VAPEGVYLGKIGYLGLAWFRVEALVTQHGRQGYSLPEGVDLTNEAERSWDKLPAR